MPPLPSPPPPFSLWCVYSCGGDNGRWFSEERCHVQLFYQCISPSSYHLLHHATTQVTTQPSSALTKTSTLSCLPQSHAQTPAVDSEICCQRLIRATGNPGPRNQYNQFSSSPACYSTEINSMRSCFPRHRPTIVSTSQDLFKTAVMSVSLTPFRTTPRDTWSVYFVRF